MNRLRQLSAAMLTTQKAIHDLQLQRQKESLGEIFVIEGPMMQGMSHGMMDDGYEMDEPDFEGDMALTELAAIADKAMMVREMIDEDSELPAWVQSKITLAAHNMNAIHDYIKYGRK
jgi:hypothetical protein